MMRRGQVWATPPACRARRLHVIVHGNMLGGRGGGGGIHSDPNLQQDLRVLMSLLAGPGFRLVSAHERAGVAHLVCSHISCAS